MMKRDLMMVALSALAGLVAGFAMSTVGAGIAMAEATASRDQLRDKLTRSLDEVMRLADRDLTAMRVERDAATAEAERFQPKLVDGPDLVGT